MKTTTFQDVLNQAAELAMRTRDKIPPQEQVLLQGFLATEFGVLFNSQSWPELIPDLVEVTVVNRQFSKNEGTASEIGDVLAVVSQNPHTTDYWHHVEYSVGDGVIYLDDPRTSVWVEYLLPYPGVTFADLSPGIMTLANFLAAPLPRRFRNILAHKAAGHLLASDNNAASAGVQFGLANAALAAEINRLPPMPAWRGFYARTGHRRRFGTAGCG